jgi:hypothetical protein
MEQYNLKFIQEHTIIVLRVNLLPHKPQSQNSNGACNKSTCEHNNYLFKNMSTRLNCIDQLV